MSDPIDGVEVVAPRSLEFEEIAAVHDSSYVEAVRSGEPRDLAVTQGFTWDPWMWRAVAASNGGVVEAVEAALTDGVAGTLSSGLHHARRERGSAYCTFNGIVIAARVALVAGVKSVLILDVDAHCGGGTHSLIVEEPRMRQIDVSVSSIDYYQVLAPNTRDIVSDAALYLDTIERGLSDVGRSGEMPGLLIHNAGMDPEERCSIGGLRGIDAAMLQAREEMVFDWCGRNGVPVAFTLAGGYASGPLTEDELVKLHRMTIVEAARAV